MSENVCIICEQVPHYTVIIIGGVTYCRMCGIEKLNEMSNNYDKRLKEVTER